MRVIAFSCVHWMERKLQVDVYEYTTPLDYRPFLKLCEIIAKDPPDVVVNLGDFTETFYGDNRHLPDVYTQLEPNIHIIKVAGNHDRNDGHQYISIDGVRYEHGHKLAANYGRATSRDEYRDMVREGVRDLAGPVVHGHTHTPYSYPQRPTQAMDVGSVTFSQTYGEIIDGEMQWKSLEED